MTTPATITFDAHTGVITCQGEWHISNIVALQTQLKKIRWPTAGKIILEGSSISTLDSSGAWLLTTLLKKCHDQHLTAELQGFSAQHQKLLSITETQCAEVGEIPRPEPLSWLARLGKTVIQQAIETRDFLSFTGELTLEVIRMLCHPGRIRWRALASTIEKTGYQALPIIALLSFMIGVVMTYQMGLQLQNYGANIFIVDLLGLAILREFAPLLTAIMVAGRTGSAFTAQLGSMKLNEEIDALNTMGITPAELLLLPRIIGLMITLPLLTIWSDIFGIIGGMVMSKYMLHVSWYDFLTRFQTQISLSTLIIGLGKAPVFALLIGAIGCFQGMKVAGNSDSVGTQTTKSVVQAIFFIIVADAFFSVIFSKLGI